MNARALLATLLLAAAPWALAERQTVCTITLNSPDEREAFRRHLPEGRFDFVERSSAVIRDCRRLLQPQVTCDVLIVSGHFAGRSSMAPRPDQKSETTASRCAGTRRVQRILSRLVAQLKEVYLFGCDTLNPTPVRVSTPRWSLHCSARAPRPRRPLDARASLRSGTAMSARRPYAAAFLGVPVIYGLLRQETYGDYAAADVENQFPLAGRHEVGTGVANDRLQAALRGREHGRHGRQGATEPNADYRKRSAATTTRDSQRARLAGIHATMHGSMAEARISPTASRSSARAPRRPSAPIRRSPRSRRRSRPMRRSCSA